MTQGHQSLASAARQVFAEGFCNHPIQKPEQGPTRCCLAPEIVREHPIVAASSLKVHIDPFGYEVPYV